MTWVRLEQNYPSHPKIAPLSDKAFRAHVTWICWCNDHLTDGLVPKSLIPKRIANELMKHGLIEDAGDEWRLHDYLDYNPSRAKVEAQREAKAEAGRKGGQRSGQTRRKQGRSKPEAGASQNRKQAPSTTESETKPGSGSGSGSEEQQPTETPPEPVRSGGPARARPRDRLREGLESPPGTDPAVVAVFDAWRRICKKPKATLEPHDPRAETIRDRLREGHSQADLEGVFRAAMADEWCREAGCKLSVLLENRERFDDLLERGQREQRNAAIQAELERARAKLAGGAS